MSYSPDRHDLRSVVNLIDDSVLADSGPPVVTTAANEFLNAVRPRIFCQLKNLVENGTERCPWKLLKLLVNVRMKSDYHAAIPRGESSTPSISNISPMDIGLKGSDLCCRK